MFRVHLSKADVTEVEGKDILDAIRSGWVAPLSPDVDALEAEITARAGAAHSLALASGTAAVHLGLPGLGAGPGTAVIVPGWLLRPQVTQSCTPAPRRCASNRSL